MNLLTMNHDKMITEYRTSRWFGILTFIVSLIGVITQISHFLGEKNLTYLGMTIRHKDLPGYITKGIFSLYCVIVFYMHLGFWKFLLTCILAEILYYISLYILTSMTNVKVPIISIVIVVYLLITEMICRFFDITIGDVEYNDKHEITKIIFNQSIYGIDRLTISHTLFDFNNIELIISAGKILKINGPNEVIDINTIKIVYC
jgi:hypothetical protein